MRTLKLLLLITLCACFADAYVRYRPSRRCIDCWGQIRRRGERFYDGCNQCFCDYNGMASCTYMDCYYNSCYKRSGRRGMYRY